MESNCPWISSMAGIETRPPARERVVGMEEEKKQADGTPILNMIYSWNKSIFPSLPPSVKSQIRLQQIFCSPCCYSFAKSNSCSSQFSNDRSWNWWEFERDYKEWLSYSSCACSNSQFSFPFPCLLFCYPQFRQCSAVEWSQYPVPSTSPLTPHVPLKCAAPSACGLRTRANENETENREQEDQELFIRVVGYM